MSRPHAASTSPRVSQVLMLGLAGEIFALEAEMVREIIDPIPATRVAGARPHLPCIVNVRGKVIPLADLRVRFGLAARDATAETRIVVIEILIEGDPVSVGLMADKVYEVAEISTADTQPIPRVGMSWKPEFIQAIVKWNNQFVIIPNMTHILN